MLKLAGTILDFTDDPDFVNDREKMALIEGKLISFDKHADLPNDAFALLVRGNTGLFRRYPVYSKVATKLSAQYFDEWSQNLHPSLAEAAAVGIKEACRHFGVAIPDSVSDLAGTKTASADRVVDARRVPSSDQVVYEDKKAAVETMLHRYESRINDMNLSERCNRATVLHEMGQKVGMQLPSTVTDYSEKNGSGPLLRLAIQQRENFAKDAGQKFATIELRKLLKDDNPQRVVEKLSVWDEKYRVEKLGYYQGGRVIDPYRAVYGGQKEAMAPMGNPEEDLRTYALQSIVAQYDDELSRVLSRKGMEQFRSDPIQFYKDTSPAMRRYLDSMVDALTRRAGDATKKDDSLVNVERKNFEEKHLNRPRSHEGREYDRVSHSYAVPIKSKATK